MSLDSLVRKHRYRFPKQLDVADVMPDLNVDLIQWRDAKASQQPELSNGSRRDMQFQFQRLEQEHAGQSMLLVLHALTISYLRRETDHTNKAWVLFERIWQEHSEFLIKNLSARWLISTLQTFFDHSPDDDDRACGGIGFTYGNLIKIYEAERNESRVVFEPDPEKELRPKEFGELGSFRAGSDILVNLHRTIFDAVVEAPLAGPVLYELLDRASEAKIVFHRLDRIADRRKDAKKVRLKYAFGGRFR